MLINSNILLRQIYLSRFRSMFDLNTAELIIYENKIAKCRHNIIIDILQYTCA